MAKLCQALTEEEIKRAGVAAVRQNYNKLAADYNKIMDGKLFYCHNCNEFHSADAFYADNRFASGLYPECKKALLEQATDYDKKEKMYVDNRDKTIDVFKKLDLPFYDTLYKSALTSTQMDVGERNRKTAFQHMITMVKSLPQYKSKTFINSEFDSDLSPNEDEINENSRILKAAKKRFGKDYLPADLVWLENEYQNWCSRTQVDSLSQETYIMQICLQLLDIDKDRKSGKDVTNKLKALDTLMNSANLQPKQNVSNAATDSLTFGQLISKWEMEKPIPQPDPELCDVSNIGMKIRVWFGGWLANALGLNVPQSQEYLDEIAKYTVTKPTVEESEGNSAIYTKMFGASE